MAKKKGSLKYKSVEEILQPLMTRQKYSIVDYNQPKSSPYERRIARLQIGRKEYSIRESYLDDYPRLQCNSLFYPQVTLSGVDEDIGHTIVHFLYTGGYETLSSASSPDSIPKEFKRSVQVYCAAMVYGIHGLAVLAKKYVEILGECVPIFDILQATRTVFSRVPDDKSWLRSYIYSKLQGAFLADETAFKSDELYRGFGEDRLFDVTLMRMLTDIYSDTISSLRHEGQKSRADHFIDHKGKIYLDFQRHVVRGIIDQKDKIR